MLLVVITFTVITLFNLHCCFFKQKTAYEMRISDWSSDVCSSDLGLLLLPPNTRNGCRFGRRRRITRFTVCQRRNRGNSADDWPCLVQRSAASGEPLASQSCPSR